jgi:hypothetical protein
MKIITTPEMSSRASMDKPGRLALAGSTGAGREAGRETEGDGRDVERWRRAGADAPAPARRAGNLGKRILLISAEARASGEGRAAECRAGA